MATLRAGKIRQIFIWLPVSSMLLVMVLILCHQFISEACRIVLVADVSEHFLGLILLTSLVWLFVRTAEGKLDYFFS